MLSMVLSVQGLIIQEKIWVYDLGALTNSAEIPQLHQIKVKCIMKLMSRK